MAPPGFPLARLNLLSAAAAEAAHSASASVLPKVDAVPRTAVYVRNVIRRPLSAIFLRERGLLIARQPSARALSRRFVRIFRLRPGVRDSVPSPVVHASASQVALYKTHQGKPFWESSDEIDVGLYAEAIATVFRFLPEEEWTPMLVKCLEPERSEAVKIAVARAGLILAIEVRSHCLIS